jgi:hypothetical protein
MNILKILKPLYDGQWHQFDELTDKTILKKEIIVEIADSLEHYGFTELSKDKQAVRFKEDFLHL